jgi:hypothetical protein
MKFTLQMFWEGEPGSAVAPFLKPLTLDFPSIDEARKVFLKTTNLEQVRVHSLTITSEDGTSERWFHIDGLWRRKDST